jgi:hydroxymethylglutaryl-CoA reductase (NADPH)
MATTFNRQQKFLGYLADVHNGSDWKSGLRPKDVALAPPIPRGTDEETVAARWQVLPVDDAVRDVIADDLSINLRDSFRRNIENFVGTVKIPVGVAGPLRINGMFAQGDYYYPLATTEATLVASYNRGARVISEAGGCTTVLAGEGLSRAPGFVFNNLTEASTFLNWTMRNTKNLRHAAEKTTQHGRLIDIKFNLEGNHVYFLFDFVTCDASGQNMTTIASEAMCKYILEKSPIKPRAYFCESNLSGDKKATMQSMQTVRGRKVTGEVFLPRYLVEKRLHATPEDIARYSRFATVASLLSGSVGTQGHYANGLAALYLACGQDVACVAESAIGITRFETTENGDLHLCVTLPNLMVATVGGGTQLPSQSACLDILGLRKPRRAHELAEVVAALCMAGELSIAAAICAQEFTQAHERFARGNFDEGREGES